jgi:hypothetical protein
MPLECQALGLRQRAVEEVGDEVGELTAGHKSATSQKILIAPFGFCNRANKSR